MGINLYKLNPERNSMFWNKKDSKSLPELPPLKSPIRPAFDIPKIEDDNDIPEPPHGLPAFPDSPIHQGFSQTAIKDAVSKNDSPESEHDQPEEHEEPEEPEESEEHEENDEHETPRAIRTMEMEEWSPQQVKLEEPPEQPMIPSMQTTSPSRERKGGDIYVKIEKFNSARRSLDSIKQKLDSIDVLLKRIRETKLREEQELSGWEKEITAIKSRIQDIGSNVFD